MIECALSAPEEDPWACPWPEQIFAGCLGSFECVLDFERPFSRSLVRRIGGGVLSLLMVIIEVGFSLTSTKDFRY